MKINHILVDMDPTKKQQPALSKAIILAKKFNASIELLLIAYNSGLMSQWFIDDERLEAIKEGYISSHRRWLDSHIKQVIDAHIPVTIDVRWHTPIYEGIIKKIKDSNADLLIKSTYQHSKVNKIFFTPNDWQLLKVCPIPLLLTKAETADEYTKIMAAIDPTQSRGKPEGLDKVILDATTSLAQTLSASAQVAHCYEAVELPMWPGVGTSPVDIGLAIGLSPMDYEEYIKQLNAHHTELFEQMIANYDFPTESKHLVEGKASETLPQIVDDNNIDLMVIGTTYRRGLLGSTAEKILDNINCDIFAVKPDDFITL
ncbi:MAG: universal stress protein [Gammaproteobacteria bacterium]|nr:MAG: universal stress protein [Gammaproteobacteria bacterium]